jgi:DNA invertase Pin-like site-specific DNA recombinase
MTDKTYRVGIYCRLSKDDGLDMESASIATQKTLLTDYVRQQGWKAVDVYADDGYTGLNFDRPDFQRMLRDIEAGKIDCVVTKDLSRFGRNYLDCGLYLEVYFPERGVRYVAVNDGVDTDSRAAMDITPFRNILNEMYSKDISAKVRSAIRARFKSGKYRAGSAPYGYLKDPNDRNHLIVDESVRAVVRMIFDLALEGNGISKITRHMNTLHVLRPAALACERGDAHYARHFEGDEENRYRWSQNSVRMILRNPVYAGHTVGYKRVAVSMKSKKRLSRLPEDWEVVRGTHEAIIPQEEFDAVQRMVTSRRKSGGTGFDNIFSGLVKCADCGYHLSAGSANRRKRDDVVDCVVYHCGNYTAGGVKSCTSHSIEARDLFDAVLSDINHFARLAKSGDKAARLIESRLDTLGKKEASAYERERRRLAKRLAELDKLFAALYEDKVEGNISERNYLMMSERYEQEQRDAAARMGELDALLSERGRNERGVSDFLSLVAAYDGITELDAQVLNALIEKITVGERTRGADGAMEQKITIFYKFVGSVEERTVTATKRYAALPDIVCERCGKAFTPGGPRARVCPECRPIVYKEKKKQFDRNRKDKRSKTHLDEPKACQRCGKPFLPGSHNARFCPECAPEARAKAAKEWRTETRRKKKAAREAAATN